MSRMIKLDSDDVDTLVSDTLVQDYKSMAEEIARLSNFPDAATHILADLDYYRNLKKSMEVVLSYYLPRETFQQVVGKDFA